jgi:AraC-like DNA-binding protein
VREYSIYPQLGLIEYINAHFDQNLKLAEIAAIAQLTEFYFYRLSNNQ